MSKILNILIVDDDLKLRSLLKKYLLEQGFFVSDAANTSEADQVMIKDQFDAIILDLMMPGESGLDFCKRLRNSGNNIPIIMLSAQGEDVDKIIGLEMGMDDYLSKPFNPRELVARIKAVTRRPQADTISSTETIYRVGRFDFDTVKRHLKSEKGQITALTSSEYDLLKALVENANIPLSRGKIMQILHSKEFEIYDRSIDVLVSRLRKLVEENPARPELIKTVWGVGYVFVSDI
ncbi:MAG: response regulator [Xanthomonadales bacterium]|nr:response regulator [Xanthomonadales bacterium]